MDSCSRMMLSRTWRLAKVLKLPSVRSSQVSFTNCWGIEGCGPSSPLELWAVEGEKNSVVNTFPTSRKSLSLGDSN